ncbi:metallothionein-3-like [Tribolium madens]|uniref:metallothionein-3-like n=1 Tax=Tribolium madens TaxID=41895 RepID=UPI001CF71DCC|nr:metallothionein-3-like [Tribolium madens]
MGICVSSVIPANNSTQPVNTVQEIVQQQPKRTKNFDADDNPLVTAGCCMCCLDPNCCCCDCCNCGDCLTCHWCCDCCSECDECCGECLKMCC